jgi:hypothetical protein
MSYSAGKVVHPRLVIIPISFRLHCPLGTMLFIGSRIFSSVVDPDSMVSLVRIRNPD